MYDRPATRAEIIAGVVFHVVGAAVCVLVATGTLSPWFLL